MLPVWLGGAREQGGSASSSDASCDEEGDSEASDSPAQDRPATARFSSGAPGHRRNHRVRLRVESPSSQFSDEVDSEPDSDASVMGRSNSSSSSSSSSRGVERISKARTDVVEYESALSTRVRIDYKKLVFLDPRLELKWREVICRQMITRGAWILLLMNFTMGFTTLVLYVLKKVSCQAATQDVFLGSTNHTLNFAFWFGTSVLLLVSLKTLKKELYLLIVVAYTLYTLLLAVPGLAQSCEQVRGFLQCAGDGDDDVVSKCDLRSYTYMQELMIWSLLTPWVIPEFRMMKFTWLWVWLFFFACTVHPQPEGVSIRDQSADVMVGVLFLCGVNYMAVRKKWSLEKGSRTKFMVMLHEKEASGKVYDILGQMLPDFIIRQMISSPGKPIADHVERVSVMFINLVDFDAVARGLQPPQLLSFLNGVFTELDTICSAHMVTKIETVGEEYVCAVGVTPEERVLEQETGHMGLLGRLVRTASDVLALPGPPGQEVALVLGLHTGPVVAGVVGRKLPRFRLFGDTMNMAARMMQTGEPGFVQLGEETREHLPEWAVEELMPRGEIEMKGIGLKRTYLLGCGAAAGHEEPRASPASAASPTRQRSATRQAYTRATTALCGRKWTLKSSHKLMQGLVAAVASVRSPEENMTKFDQVVSDVSSQTSSHSPPVIFVSKEENKEFFGWFCTNILFSRIHRRLRRQAMFLTSFSCTELLLLLFVMDGYQSWGVLGHSLWRLRWFLLCRGLILALVLTWLFNLAKKNSSCLQVHHGSLQRWLVLSVCTTAVLMFISYDYLPGKMLMPLGQLPSDVHQENYQQQVVISGLSLNIHSLVCFPAYSLVTMAHQFLFRGAFALLVVAVVLMLLNASGWGGEGLMLPDLGRLLFVLGAVLQVFEAYFEESRLRGKFQATCALNVARRRIEGVLERLMPPMVIKELRRSLTTKAMGTLAHPYADATILQADLCGFTKLARTRKPEEVVEMIGQIFGLFDRQAEQYEVYKVETVGDAYIAGQAGPPLTVQKSPVSVIRLGLDMIQKLEKWSANKGEDVGCRVGIHTGECIGGIVGTTMQRYHLFGELMSCVDLLESTSRQGMVQVSSACKLAADAEMGELAAGAKSSLQDIKFVLRNDPTLRTSKGYEHEYARVGGPTYFMG